MNSIILFLGGGLLHPLRGNGYQFWSGIESDAQQWLEWMITLAVVSYGAVKTFRHWKSLHTCHVETCHRVAWHPHPVHGHPVCKPHWLESGEDHNLTHPHAPVPHKAEATPVRRRKTGSTPVGGTNKKETGK